MLPVARYCARCVSSAATPAARTTSMTSAAITSRRRSDRRSVRVPMRGRLPRSRRVANVHISPLGRLRVQRRRPLTPPGPRSYEAPVDLRHTLRPVSLERAWRGRRHLPPKCRE
jgi:hypothetical protein